jgi:hypothetical protein
MSFRNSQFRSGWVTITPIPAPCIRAKISYVFGKIIMSLNSTNTHPSPLIEYFRGSTSAS